MKNWYMSIGHTGNETSKMIKNLFFLFTVVFWACGLMLAGPTISVHADLLLVEDFDGRSTGSGSNPDDTAANGVLGGFLDSQSNGSGNIQVQGGAGADSTEVLRVESTSSGDERGFTVTGVSNPIGENESGVLFFRFRHENQDGRAAYDWFGITGVNMTSAGDDALSSGNGNDAGQIIAAGFLCTRESLTGGDPISIVTIDTETELMTVTPGTWYDCWIDVNNNAKTFSLYIQESTAPGASPPSTGPSTEALVTNYPFNIPDAGALYGWINMHPDDPPRPWADRSVRVTSDDIYWDGDSGLVSRVAQAPNPSTGSILVPITGTVLSWEAPAEPSDETVTYDVYFGTDADCDSNPQVAADQLANSFDPGPLALDTTYYWRVDVIDPNGGGDPIVVPGICWSFSTCTSEPVIIEDPEGMTVDSGDAAVFTVSSTCGATGWQWKKDGVDLVDAGDIAGATTDTLTISNVELADEGNYSVVVSNGAGSDTSTEAELLTCRLMGHWKLDGDLLDSVQDTVPGAPTHDGQVIAGADAGETFAAGVDGQAFDFTGDPNSNVVEIIDSTDYFNFFPRGFTVSAWINDPNANGYNGLVSKQEECCNNVATGWTLEIDSQQEGVITIRSVGNSGGGATQAIDIDAWHLLTATYDASTGVRRFYLDGLLSDEDTSVASPVASDGPVVFGAEDVMGQVVYDGLLDDVRIYSCPLTATDVVTLYTNFVSETLDVDKVRVKAGKDRSNPEDMIIIQGDLDVDEAAYNVATSIFARISTDDLVGSYERTIPAPSSEEELPELKNGNVRFKGVGDPDSDAGQFQLQLKFNRNGRTGKYKIIGKKIDLSGLEATGANPMVIELLFGGFNGVAELVEDADDVIINSKQSMPMCLLSGLKDKVGVDKVVAKPDQVTINKGQISALNPDLDLSTVDVTVFWDFFDETIPAGEMVDKGNGKFIYTKPRGASDDLKIKKLQIDLNKCMLKLQIKDGENLTSTGSAIFGLQAGDGGDAFDASIVVDLPD